MKIIKENTEDSKFFSDMRLFLSEKITADEFAKSDSNIRQIIPNSDIAKSIIVIQFESDDEFFDVIDLDENDQDFYHRVTSPYHSFEFIESYQVEEDFKEGWGVFSLLNKENVEKLKLIQKILMPEKSFDLESPYFVKSFSVFLWDSFESEIDEILDYLRYYRNEEMKSTADKHINDEIEEYVGKLGFEIQNYFTRVKTTVSNIFMLYFKNGVHTNLSLIEVLKLNFKKMSNRERIGAWWDNMYEFTNFDNFDNDSFNREVERNLDKIIDKIDDDVNISNYVELYDKINKTFKFDIWISIPKNYRYSYKLTGLDVETKRLKLLLKDSKKNKITREFSLSEENFYKLLYQPDLFDMEDIFDY